MLFFLDFSQESMNGFNNALGGFLPPTTNSTHSLSNPASEYCQRMYLTEILSHV